MVAHAHYATGNVRKHANGCSARVRIGPGLRPSFELAVGSENAAEARAELLAAGEAPAPCRRRRGEARGQRPHGASLHEAKEAAEARMRKVELPAAPRATR